MSTYVVIGLGSALVFLLLLGCVRVFPRLLVPDLPADSLQDVRAEKDRLSLQTDRLKVRNDARTGLFQALGGAALIAGLFFTWVQLQDNRTQLASQQDLTRRGQIADRFTRAVDQLGNAGSVDVRLGGIYGLEQVARDSPDDRIRLAAYEVLTAYVRRHAIWEPNSPPLVAGDPNSELQRRIPDAQAVLTVLGRRGISKSDPPMDLHGADLRGADLSLAHLDGAYLADAHLEDALLAGAHLEDAFLSLAHLDRAYLADAHLAHADLRTAHLEGAHLEGAELNSARLEGALADGKTTWPPFFDWKAAGVRMPG